jgi:hypothetical protein
MFLLQVKSFFFKDLDLLILKKLLFIKMQNGKKMYANYTNFITSKRLKE